MSLLNFFANLSIDAMRGMAADKSTMRSRAGAFKKLYSGGPLTVSEFEELYDMRRFNAGSRRSDIKILKERDEPGVYVAGHFGVRLENTLLVRHWRTTDFGRFLEFEPLTLCPFDRAPIDRALLRPDEVAWLDDYHAEVRRRLLPLLDDEADRQWLTEATRPLHDE